MRGPRRALEGGDGFNTIRHDLRDAAEVRQHGADDGLADQIIRPQRQGCGAEPADHSGQAITVNQFRDRLREHVEKVLADHEPLKVTRRNGGAFIVVGAEDWEREQETLYVLQNRSLMEQIVRSSETHAAAAGYRPTEEQLGEIDRL